MSTGVKTRVAELVGADSGRRPVRDRLPVYVLLVTSLVSVFGNQLTAIAVPWFVLETTGSASLTGVTAAVTIIPVVIATFFGGALVDRTGYKALSVFSDLISAVTVAAVPVFYHTTGLSFVGLLVLMFLGAIFDAPGSTARQAMIPSLSRISGIPLEKINASFGMLFAATSLFAAPLAGVLIAALGPVNVLWFNAGTFVFSGLVILGLVPVLERAAPSGESFLTDVRIGLAYVRNHALIRTIVIAALLINMLFAPIFGVAIPVYANQELQSVRALGIMYGGEGFGALVGSFIYGQLANRIKRRPYLLMSVLIISLPLIPLAFSPDLWLSTALVSLVGLGSGMVNPMIGTFLQQTTPPHLLGRVSGLVRAGAQVATPIGMLLGGTMIAALTYSGSFLLIGGLMLVIFGALVVNQPLHTLDAEPEPEVTTAPATPQTPPSSAPRGTTSSS
jgi:MFS family permease